MTANGDTDGDGGKGKRPKLLKQCGNSYILNRLFVVAYNMYILRSSCVLSSVSWSFSSFTHCLFSVIAQDMKIGLRSVWVELWIKYTNLERNLFEGDYI